MFIAMAIFLSLWFLLSVFLQFRSKAAMNLLSKDRFLVTATFNFFAPDPVEADLHLLYRIVLADSIVQPWREVPLIQYRPLSAVLWNPRARIHAAVRCALASIAKVMQEDPKKTVQETPPYLFLLNTAIRYSSKQRPASVQFSLLKSCMFPPQNQPMVVAKSALHAIGSE